MEKAQADAIAQAILEPGLRTQENVRRKRAAETPLYYQKRRVAWFSLIGFGVGALAAYLLGLHILSFGIWGSFAGSVLGWLIKRPVPN